MYAGCSGKSSPDSPRRMSWPRLRWSLTWDQGKEMALHGHGR
jgi:hypothetical protein